MTVLLPPSLRELTFCSHEKMLPMLWQDSMLAMLGFDEATC